jgi:hypothetical protein
LFSVRIFYGKASRGLPKKERAHRVPRKLA